jgi:hypothetical protein
MIYNLGRPRGYLNEVGKEMLKDKKWRMNYLKGFFINQYHPRDNVSRH